MPPPRPSWVATARTAFGSSAGNLFSSRASACASGELATVCHHLPIQLETVGQETVACTKCGEQKPLTSEFFMRRPNRPWPWYQPCRKCRSDASISWQRANPERVRANDRKRYVSRRRTLIERVMQKIDKRRDGCWLWLGKTQRDGYGVVWSGGTRKEGRELRVHRVMYEHFRGAIPDGLVLDHLCRVRNCVNPDHLDPVTLRENLDRGVSGHVLTKADREKGGRRSAEVRRRTAAS